MLLLTVGLVVGVVVVKSQPVAPAPAPLTVSAPPPPAPIVEPTPPPAEPVVVPPPRVAPVAQRPRTPVVAKPIATTVVVGDVTGGDPLVRKALQRTFARSLGRLDVRPRSETGYAVTMHIDEHKAKGEAITLRCSVTVSLLPRRNVLASLKARADVEGSGTPIDELFNDAAEACGQALGKDLTGWVKSHPL
ncbi:MAG: hypothetical protein Q8O67_24795 [Deltaproteobacteria bacterium]|nr:hypothetical protein [Deltaproteobacteria bacterium]